jgi:hypothetical protein
VGGRLPALLQSLRAFISVLCRLSATYLSLMNVVTFFISSNSQIPQSSSSSLTPHCHLSSVIFIPCTPTHHDLSLAVVRLNVVVHYCCRRFRCSLYFWEQCFLYALPSFCPHHTHNPHVFPKLHTYTHLPLSGLSQCPKQTEEVPLSHRCAASGPAAVDTDHLYDAAPRAATGRDCTHCTVVFFFLTLSYPLRSLRCRLSRRLESFLFLFPR